MFSVTNEHSRVVATFEPAHHPKAWNDRCCRTDAPALPRRIILQLASYPEPLLLGVWVISHVNPLTSRICLVVAMAMVWRCSLCSCHSSLAIKCIGGCRETYQRTTRSAWSPPSLLSSGPLRFAHPPPLLLQLALLLSAFAIYIGSDHGCTEPHLQLKRWTRSDNLLSNKCIH